MVLKNSERGVGEKEPRQVALNFAIPINHMNLFASFKCPIFIGQYCISYSNALFSLDIIIFKFLNSKKVIAASFGHSHVLSSNQLVTIRFVGVAVLFKNPRSSRSIVPPVCDRARRHLMFLVFTVCG